MKQEEVKHLLLKEQCRLTFFRQDGIFHLLLYNWHLIWDKMYGAAKGTHMGIK